VGEALPGQALHEAAKARVERACGARGYSWAALVVQAAAPGPLGGSAGAAARPRRAPLVGKDVASGSVPLPSPSTSLCREGRTRQNTRMLPLSSCAARKGGRPAGEWADTRVEDWTSVYRRRAQRAGIHPQGLASRNAGRAAIPATGNTPSGQRRRGRASGRVSCRPGARAAAPGWCCAACGE
jgi:hypothetical protein